MTDFTRREIKTRFMELLSEKNLDKITVKELADVCGISRNTFYYHYHDIFEVMEDIFHNEIIDASSNKLNLLVNFHDVHHKQVLICFS